MRFDKVRFQHLLSRCEKPSRYLDHEIHAHHKQVGSETVNFCLAFPDVYEVGISHLGLKILYSILNRDASSSADRVYAPWPDFGDLLKAEGLPVFGLESHVSLADFDVVGFTLQSELNFTNILYLLDLGGIPSWSADRTEGHPLIIAGGPCSTNPLPLADVVDAFLIGDGEEAILEISHTLHALRTGSRQEKLLALAQVEGMYVPAVHAQETVIQSRKYMGFSTDNKRADAQLIPWQQGTHDRFTAEIMRGCTRGCRFCHAGYFYRPVRERSPEAIIQSILREVEESGWEEAALVSLSSSDYTCIRPLLLALHERLKANGATISLPSLRVDSLDQELVQLINAVGKAGLTIAPEAGSQRLRDIINKNITEEEILEGIHIALENGWQLVKLYFIVGLPGETEEDVEAIIGLIEKIIGITRKKIQIHVSLSPFVPKPHTPFQWSEFRDPVQLLARILHIKHSLSKYRFVKVKYHQIESSMLEALICRGDRETGKLMVEAYRMGARFDGWNEYFDFTRWTEAAAKIGMTFRDYLSPKDKAAVLPWDFIDIGVSREFMEAEWEKSQAQITTLDCREGCTGCGVCVGAIGNQYVPEPSRQIPSYEVSGETGTWEKVRAEYRVFYQKTGDLRFISHLDLMRMIFRLVRRNHLPVTYTQGFNPHPRIRLCPPLPNGVEGEHEFFDLMLDETIPDAEVLACLKVNFADVLPVMEIQRIGKEDAVNWDATGSEIIQIQPPAESHLAVAAAVQRFQEAETFTFLRQKKGRDIPSDLKTVIESLTWHEGVLTLRKRLKGAGLYEILDQVFGWNRDEMNGFRLVRKELSL